jgi:hypothetical protein
MIKKTTRWEPQHIAAPVRTLYLYLVRGVPFRKPIRIQKVSSPPQNQLYNPQKISIARDKRNDTDNY